jgi:hypothetical protein
MYSHSGSRISWTADEDYVLVDVLALSSAEAVLSLSEEINLSTPIFTADNVEQLNYIRLPGNNNGMRYYNLEFLILEGQKVWISPDSAYGYWQLLLKRPSEFLHEIQL